MSIVDTGYRIREGSAELERRYGHVPETVPCSYCGETVAPDGTCLNVGDCRRADRSASRRSHVSGRAGAVAFQPRAFTIGGRVD